MKLNRSRKSIEAHFARHTARNSMLSTHQIESSEGKADDGKVITVPKRFVRLSVHKLAHEMRVAEEKVNERRYTKNIRRQC